MSVILKIFFLPFKIVMWIVELILSSLVLVVLVILAGGALLYFALDHFSLIQWFV